MSVYVYPVYVLSSVGGGLVTGESPFQFVLATVRRLNEPKERARPNNRC
jgi:hypothetical protein